MYPRIIAIALLVAFFPLSVLAEQQGSEKNSNSKETDGINRMAKDLGLNDEQKARVESIINTEKQTVESIFKEQGEKLKSAQQQTHDNLQQVLNPEQMSKLEKKVQQQSKRQSKQKK